MAASGVRAAKESLDLEFLFRERQRQRITFLGKRTPVIGNPDPARICTPIVKRQNLNMRMSIRRLTRLTLCFSKKFEHLWAALCLHFAYYNFCRIHRTLRVTPAMEAGIANHVWTIEELIAA